MSEILVKGRLRARKTLRKMGETGYEWCMDEVIAGEELKEADFARETLERYSGSKVGDFCSNLLLTNFPRYVDHFAERCEVEVIEGMMFKVAHCPKEDVSILDFKIGSTAAALVVDLCSFLPVEASLLLGMCGGLRRRYKVGDYLVPVASIRDEGTSGFYFPSEVPALANFLCKGRWLMYWRRRGATTTLELPTRRMSDFGSSMRSLRRD